MAPANFWLNSNPISKHFSYTIFTSQMWKGDTIHINQTPTVKFWKKEMKIKIRESLSSQKYSFFMCVIFKPSYAFMNRLTEQHIVFANK